eukprot:TRINITY_DN1897_c0_g1_i1.p1 TRINITY_DN1897_c0_g1~~TRINITY_DN1897_c0_g1_i1.p1  ORF type:complete len:1520 (-),score=534.45 TRINITY_DN1897_c0_g1_i1:436-4995(-)
MRKADDSLFISAFGQDIPVKRCGSNLLLERSALQAASLLPSSDRLQTVLERRRASSSLHRPHISWKLLRVLLLQGLPVQSLKDLLNAYEAFMPFDSTSMPSRAHTARLSKDTLTLNGIPIPFKVAKGGKAVYLEILGACTLLGKMKLGMSKEWKGVEGVLAGMENEEPEDKLLKGKKPVHGHGSHITLKALVALNEELVMDEDKRKHLRGLLRHLLGEVEAVVRRWEDVHRELEEGVRKMMAQCCEMDSAAPKVREPLKSIEPDETPASETESNKSSHLATPRCCQAHHVLSLADKCVGYIVKADQIFLEKYNSFSSLGRRTLRDYRKSDKILESSGIKPKEHYLLQTQKKGSSNRRRTHISLEAFLILVHMGWADSPKKDSIIESLRNIADDVVSLKERCPNYFQTPASTEEEEESDEDLSLIHEESGIESGTNSDSSGKNSPSSVVVEEDREVNIKPEEEEEGSGIIQIPRRVENGGTLYLSLSSVFLHLFPETPEFIPKVKALARQSPELKLPFFPSHFKKGNEKYIRPECLLRLLTNKEVSLREGVSETELQRDLQALSQETSKELLDESDDEEDEGILDNGVLLQESPSCLNIEGLSVPFQVVNDILYLDKKIIFQLLRSHKNASEIDDILGDSEVSLEDAFLYEGLRRSFISSGALKVLICSHLPIKFSSRDSLLECLIHLENQREALKTNRILNLKSFEPLPFKSQGGKVYVHTLQLMKAVGFSPSYVDSSPSKAYLSIIKLLSRKGLNVEPCFLRQGKSKYLFISLHAALLLFQTEFGPFKDKEKLRSEMLEALKEHGLTFTERKGKRRSHDELTMGNEFPRLKYRIKDELIYIHRKSLFEHLGLQKVILSGAKGFEPLNAILVNCGLSLDKAYIGSRQEMYSYMSLEAALLILDSQEPLMVCLQRREKFLTSLLLTIQGAIGSILGSEVILKEGKAIPCKFNRNRVYLLRHTCYSLSGLYDKSSSLSDYDIYEYPAAPLADRGFTPEDCFLPEGGDEYAYISIDALLVLMNLDGDRGSSSHAKPHWENLISAISLEVPKLKVRVKMEAFRGELIAVIVRLYSEYIRNPKSKRVNRVELIDLVTEDEDSTSEECDFKRAKIDHFDVVHAEQFAEPSSEYESIKTQILTNSQGGMIGSWEVKRMDDELIRLIIPPGSSRKMSFIHPDVAALLSYEFLIQHDLRFAFFINEQEVPSELVRGTVESISQSGGFLNLLYQLLTLRPCFGSFNPELVETVEKGLVDCSGNDVDNIENLCSQIRVDANFIGSSQNGRTYAGTVRSQNCKVLADSGVSDTCSQCAHLHRLVINRSMLTDEAIRRDDPSASEDLNTLPSGSSQRSVWKIESTDASGCHFVCPQIQSFNSSPPHNFLGSSQATSIVLHKVEISSTLHAKVTLNGRNIHKVFDDFARNRLVGRLLDQVASLRYCLGYPDAELVKGARYIIENKHHLLNNGEVKKYFDCITVDESFLAKMTGTNEELKGTLRIKTCRFVSGEFADLCDQCRLLQEPLEFIGV